MVISDLSIRRPVVSLVLTLVVVIVGALAFGRLPVREYPNIDPPVISVSTFYRGAAAEVVETKVTRPLEDQLSTVEGVRIMTSRSGDQSSGITLEFNLGRDIEAAANDVRDRVSRARGRLPEDVDEPTIEKVDADASPFLRIVLVSDTLDLLSLGDIADRMVKTRLQTLPGVGNIEMRTAVYAMRVWLDPGRLAAYDLTVGDVERALRQQNVDIPGGRIESLSREFPVRVDGGLREASDFENLVVATRGLYQVKLRDVARVELGQEDYRVRGYFQGRQVASLGVIRQSQSNLLEVSAAVKAELERIRPQLPEGVEMRLATDTTPFVEKSVDELFHAILVAAVLVVVVIFVFLRDWRSTLIPIVAIPVSLVGTFAAMAALGFSLNILTLLAMVLAVGLVVDDAIVVLENVYRRVETGEKPIHAAVFGARQVAFAVIATTLVLVAVFVPVAFQQGQTGRLFYEFGLTLAISVAISSFVALSLTPMLCSRLLKGRSTGVGGKPAGHNWVYRVTEPVFVALNRMYAGLLRWSFRWQVAVLVVAAGAAVVGPLLWGRIPRELTPQEDRGVFRGQFIGPQGATPEYVRSYAQDFVRILSEYEVLERFFILTGIGSGNVAFVAGGLKDWSERDMKTQELVAEINRRFATEITGGLARVSPVRPIGQRGAGDSFVFALKGGDFDKLQASAEAFAARMRDSGMFAAPRIEPSPTKPQLDVQIERAKAADLGVAVSDVASTLETLFGGRRVTDFRRAGEQYDVILQVEDGERATPSDLGRVYVSSASGALVQLSNLVRLEERVVPESYPHLDRLRTVRVSSQMQPGKTLGDGVAFVASVAPGLLPDGYSYVFDGETREFLESGQDTYLLFGLALLFTFLILAAQFESWLHPVTIFTGVFLAVSAGIVTLWLTGFGPAPVTNNIFSQFGLIMLIGLIAKNGILIVEFANQLQIEGRRAHEAAFEAAVMRFRPILMTAISTVFGALPLALASGAGAEVRQALGVVIVGGLALSTGITLFVIPIVYVLLDRAVVWVTGHSSAHGLVKAKEIEAETAAG